MPRPFIYQTAVDVPPETLFAAIVRIDRWPEWDPDLRATEHDGTPVRAGTRFWLTPRGGPRTSMRVSEVEAPRLFADVARLPLARMHTRHVFEPDGAGGTLMGMTIETRGPLAMVWDRVIVRKQAAGAAEQARRFVAFARAMERAA